MGAHVELGGRGYREVRCFMVFDSPFALHHAPSKPWITLCCEHGGQRRPSHWVLDPDEERIFQDHWGWDPGAAALSRSLAKALGADTIIGNWSRLVADLNRPPEHQDLCREHAEDIPLRFNQGLSSEQRKARVDGVHAPYHQALDALLHERQPQLLLSVHSFTPVFMGPDGPQERLVELGVLFDENEALADQLIDAMQGSGLTVKANAPYSGKLGMIYSAQRHGRRHGLPYLELELRQDLLTTEAKLARITEALVPALVTLKLERLPGL
jgi:predicted N-formylglutamate amidohydrolase